MNKRDKKFSGVFLRKLIDKKSYDLVGGTPDAKFERKTVQMPSTQFCFLFLKTKSFTKNSRDLIGGVKEMKYACHMNIIVLLF